MAFRFEGLEVFELAVSLSHASYRLTRTFPREEMFGLTANLRRAATSVALNIAEGSGRGTRREFARFIDVARGSLFETVSAFLVAERLGFIQSNSLAEFRDKAEELSRKLASFKRSLVDTEG